MTAMAAHLALGRAGEEAACRYLAGLGWSVVARNWRPAGRERGLELDIVARHGGEMIFVEVKTRRGSRNKAGNRAGSAEAVPARAAFTARKQARLARAASCFLSASGLWHLPCRFDLLCIEPDAAGKPFLEHYRNVIELGHFMDSGNAAWQPW